MNTPLAIPVDWNEVAVAFLHDPPDKALAIRTHVARTSRYLETCGLPGPGKGRHDDMAAAIAERLPMPSGRKTGDWTEISVGPTSDDDGTPTLTVVHPLAGTRRQIALPSLDEGALTRILAELCGNTGGRERFLRLWRLLPARLAQLHPAYAFMPADTRVPDHTIWHHADITAAFAAAGVGLGSTTNREVAFLSISLGPVQEFIAAARSLRDLHAGSYLLADLMFHTLLPAIEALGPQAVVFPYLRGNPFVDRWLREQIGKHDELKHDDRALLSPSLPNRALLVVPAQHASAIARACREAGRARWLALAEKVQDLLRSRPDWLEEDFAHWQHQIEHAFDFRTAVAPFRPLDASAEHKIVKLFADTFENAFPDAAKVRALARAIPAHQRPRYEQDNAGRWQLYSTYAARHLNAARSVRHVPPHSPPDDTRFKCTIDGRYEAMGPISSEFEEFWSEDAPGTTIGGVRVRDGERLSAVSLVKRFAPVVVRRERNVGRDATRFPDTATVATAMWLERAGIDPDDVCRGTDEVWSGQWLYQRSPLPPSRRATTVPAAVWQTIRAARRKHGEPPAYFGALLLDGDHMGKWLQGRNTPQVRNIMHPDLVHYFENLRDPDGSVRAALDARRHTGPTIHAAISEALGTFSLHVVPRVVEDSRGELIYAGGDDVLALLPVETALRCALRLYRGFRGELGPDDGWPQAPTGFVRLAAGEPERLAMGPLATASCGIAIVHYKDDLRAALAAARRAEKAAKEGGRDRLGLIARRRSGEHSLSVVPWRMIPLLDALVRLYAREDAPTDRWAYRLRAAADGLGGLPVEAITLEIERLIARTEENNELRPTLLGLARELWTLHAASHPEAADVATTPELVESFAILIQTASFMARGRDDR